jgi:transposase-like protein
MNTTSTPQEEEKLIDIASHEDRLRVPLHKQEPCRYCSRTWYLSEGLLQFHRDQKQTNDHWKFPTSCPECRPLSAATTASRRSNCPSSKVEFGSKAEAEKYERFNREKHNSVEQYVYYCAKCHNYHLTTNKPTDTSSGALASPLGRAAASAPPAPVAAPTAPAPAGESRELAACRMYREGALIRDISAALNAAAPTIYQWLKKNNVPMRTTGRPASAKPAPSPFKAPIVDFDTEEARLLAQLEEVRRKRQMLEKAKRLRVELVGATAFLIMKEGEHATLPMDELVPLIDQLMALVPQTEQVEPEAI